MADPPTLLPFVDKLVRRCALADIEKRALLTMPHKVRRLDRGAYVSRERARCENCLILLSGFAYSSKTGSDGARAVLALHMTGEILDIAACANDEAACDVQALTSAQIA